MSKLAVEKVKGLNNQRDNGQKALELSLPVKTCLGRCPTFCLKLPMEINHVRPSLALKLLRLDTAVLGPARTAESPAPGGAVSRVNADVFPGTLCSQYLTAPFASYQMCSTLSQPTNQNLLPPPQNAACGPYFVHVSQWCRLAEDLFSFGSHTRRQGSFPGSTNPQGTWLCTFSCVQLLLLPVPAVGVGAQNKAELPLPPLWAVRSSLKLERWL